MHWQYLFKLPTNIYNNEAPAYEFYPIRGSDQSKVIVFSGKMSDDSDEGVVYVFLKLRRELKDNTKYRDLQRLLNLIYLETGLPTKPIPVPIGNDESVKEILSRFGSKNFYYPDRSYSGTATEPNHIKRVGFLVSLLNKLEEKDFERFDNALNTYIWALELRELPNLHLKHTLYMTLFLSSINQLANDPVYCENHPVCSKCGKTLCHQTTGEVRSIENLMRELLTGNQLEEGVKKVKKLYSELRSSFLHSGKLSGKEKEGGFLFDIKGTSDLLVDEMEILLVCRQLLEQFLLKNANYKKN